MTRIINGHNFLILLLIPLLALAPLATESKSQSDLQRDLDPVIFTGESIPNLLNLSVDNIKVFSYNAQSDTWSSIPFQVDERQQDGNYFGTNDGILNNFDEIILLARDMGDMAPDDQSWPDDIESKQYIRYEIAATNPASNEKAYAYIFYSPTLGKNVTSYVSYNNDRISASTYGVSHKPNIASGLPDSIAIPASAGGDGIDFLDRQRIRLELTASISGISIGIPAIKENMDEDISFGILGSINLKVSQKEFSYISGPLRIKRKNVLLIEVKGSVAGNSIDATETLSLTYTYYPWYIELSSEGREIPVIEPGGDAEARLKKMSLSNALSSNGFGMIYYSEKVPKGIRVNDVLHEGYVGGITGEWPGKHWFAEVADPNYEGSILNNATLFTIIDLRGDPVGSEQAMIFQEYDELDGYRVYGNAGLQFVSNTGSIAGALDVFMKNYYLGENYNYDQLVSLFNTYSVPLVINTSEQVNDHVAPAKTNDLAVTFVDETTATLAWTVPADDGSEGLAPRQYIIRYSTTVPVGDNDWDWWSSAMTLPSPPEPTAAGTQQSITVSDLDPSTVYYFMIRTADEVPNWSDLSNPASGVTTPVELQSFNARQSGNNVLLQWTTASESNNLGFAVERKKENEGSWQERGFVQGAGTTSDLQSYSFEDNLKDVGSFSYRLKQLDTNGSFTYSNVITIDIKAPDQFMLAQNYPNPFNPTTMISYQVPQYRNGLLNITIYDMLGRNVRTLVNEEVNAGFYRVEWDGRDDAGNQVVSGMYIYMMTNGDFRMAKKMVKLQ